MNCRKAAREATLGCRSPGGKNYLFTQVPANWQSLRWRATNGRPYIHIRKLPDKLEFDKGNSRARPVAFHLLLACQSRIGCGHCPPDKLKFDKGLLSGTPNGVVPSLRVESRIGCGPCPPDKLEFDIKAAVGGPNGLSLIAGQSVPNWVRALPAR